MTAMMCHASVKTYGLLACISLALCTVAKHSEFGSVPLNGIWHGDSLCALPLIVWCPCVVCVLLLSMVCVVCTASGL